MSWEHVPNGSWKFGVRNANIYRNGEVKKRSSSTQTAAQSPLDPRTLNGGQETLKKLLRGKNAGEMAGVTDH